MMRIAPAIVMILAAVAVLFSIFGGGGYSNFVSLEENLEAQRTRNEELKQSVSALQKKAGGLRNDSRAIEKAARDGLGMAGKNEMIFIFEQD